MKAGESSHAGSMSRACLRARYLLSSLQLGRSRALSSRPTHCVAASSRGAPIVGRLAGWLTIGWRITGSDSRACLRRQKHSFACSPPKLWTEY